MEQLTPAHISAAVSMGIKAAMDDSSQKKAWMANQIIGVTNLAKYLGVSRVTAQKYKSAGLLPFKQIGRKIYFEISEVNKVLESKKTA